MVLKYPCYIIFHQGGSGGDFLTSVLNYLHHKSESSINIITNGRNVPPNFIEDFKNFSKNILNGRENNLISTDYYALGSHDYSPKLRELYPETKFYYIDYTKNEIQTYKRFFSLEFKNDEDAIVKKLKEDNILSKKLQLKITINNWESIAQLAWNNWLKLYEFYQIEKIPLEIFFNYVLFSKILEEKFLLVPDDYVKVMFDIWQEKNKKFFKQLQED
jgi:hypothetical protein